MSQVLDEAVAILDEVFLDIVGDAKAITEARSHLAKFSIVDLVPAVILDAIVECPGKTVAALLPDVRGYLLERADSIREIALAIPIPDGATVFKMSPEDRKAAYETLRNHSHAKGVDHIRKIIVRESCLPGNWGAALDDGMTAYENAKCPQRWIAYDVHSQVYVTGMGALAFEAIDNGRQLTDAQAFVEICRVE